MFLARFCCLFLKIFGVLATESFISNYEVGSMILPHEALMVVSNGPALRHVVGAYSEKIFIVWSLDCENVVNGRIVSVDGTSIHLESVMDIFQDTNSINLLLCWNQVSMQEYTSILPARTVFVSSGAKSSFNVCNLAPHRRAAGFGPPILIHLDMPSYPAWPISTATTLASFVGAVNERNATNQIDDDDQLPCTVGDVPGAYSGYQLVIRRGYSKALFGAAPTVTERFYGGGAVTNVHWWSYGTLYPRRYRQLKATGSVAVVASANRQYWCFFADLHRETYEESSSSFLLSRDSFISDATLDRELLAQLSDGMASTSRVCDVVAADQWRHDETADVVNSVDSDRDDDRLAVYKTYVDHLGMAIFTPCPYGAHAETYRHYEAMEMGSIPLMVKIDAYCTTAEECLYVEDADFLKLWKDYPGPVFNTWAHALNYMQNVDVAEVQRLQRAIVDWHVSFKVAEKVRLSNALRDALRIAADY